MLLLVSIALAAFMQDAPADARVTIASDGWTLVGNFVQPRAEGRAPAVLLLNGATRDRRAYILLARELAARGIASLRLDLRGEGESTNLGRFEPYQPRNPAIAGEERDVAAALAWLRAQPRVDGSRIGVVGASYSGESMARAARAGSRADAYVALSPGSFSDESIRGIDPSGVPWWFIASRQERFARTVVEGIPAVSRTARVTFVDGTSHASDILSPHANLNAEIADWFAARLTRRAAPPLWGGLDPGAFDVGFERRETHAGGRALFVDVWYPAAAPARSVMTFGDYLSLSTDLRDADPDFPGSAAAVERSLSTAISGSADAVDPTVIRRILESPMLARRDVGRAPGRYPLVLWAPRYATTVAQSVMSEFLASHGFVVACVRPASEPVKLPFELATADAKRAELAARLDDMAAVVAGLEGRAGVDTSRIGVIGWSYTGEMASGYQQRDARVSLVIGLSTTLLKDWVYRDDLAAFDGTRITVPYAAITQRGTEPGAPPAAFARAAAPAYFIEMPGLAHGSFNALEGAIPSLMGITTVQRWSKAGSDVVAGYDAVSTMVLRLLRNHVAGANDVPVSPLMLTSGFGANVAVVR